MGLMLTEKLPDDVEVSGVALRFYYENLFPFELLQRWLSYRNCRSGVETALNDPLFLAKREICLTCKRTDAKDEEFFMRWQCFSTFEALKQRVLSLSDFYCHKFDIGGVYSLPVSQKETHAAGFKPQQKELIFDIDMNDYDDVRTCCKDKKVCKKCWLFLAVAVRLLTAALQNDFGFKHILWVFSGRRGIHCWVCDTDARLLSNESRGQLAEYLNICTGSDQQAKKVHLWGRTQHPAVERAFAIAYSRFHRLLSEQDMFFASGWGEKLLEYLPEDSYRNSNASVLSGNNNYNNKHPVSANTSHFSGSSGSKGSIRARAGAEGGGWLRGEIAGVLNELKSEKAETTSKNKYNRSVRLFEKICQLAGCQTPATAASTTDVLDATTTAAAARETESIPNYIKEIVLAISYPRLDINVSKDIGHLLKSPFCIHQGTGRVCVPVDLLELESFDPQRVPTLSHLRRQFDDPERIHLHPKERTALSPFLTFFEKSFLAPLEQTCLEEIKFLRESLEGYTTSLKVEDGF